MRPMGFKRPLVQIQSLGPKRDSDYDTIRVPLLLPISCVACYNDLDKSGVVEVAV